jgi:hypothetical protein
MRRVPVLALLLFGCAKNGAEGMVILANTAPTGSTCVFTGDPSQPAFSSGQISAESPDAYLLTPLIESRITAAGSGDSVDRSILLNGANITLTATQDGANVSLAESLFSTPVSGTIPPGGTINVAFPIIPVDVLSAFENATTQTEVVANVTVFGTEGGDLGTCVGLTSTVNLGNPCNPFQDGIVDCCEDAITKDLICPAVSETVGSGSGSGM